MSSSSHPNRRRAFALLAVAYFMTTVDLTIVNVSLPTIGRDLHFSEIKLAVGRHRLRADVRRLLAPRRTGRGSARPSPNPDAGARPVHDGLVGLRARR